MEFLGFCCMLAFGLPLFCVFWAAVISIFRLKHFWLWMCASVPAFFVVVFALLSFGWWYSSLPSVIFHDSFGFWPTPDVKIVNSFHRDSVKFDDSYLELYAKQPTIDRILANGFEPIVAKDIPPEHAEVPSWWTPNLGPGSKIFSTAAHDPKLHGEFSYFIEHQLLVYDPVSKRVYQRYYR